MKRRYLLPFVVGSVIASLASSSRTARAADADAPPLDDQVIEDVTPLPAGMGAIFVPVLTTSSQEPPVVVQSDGERIASGETGSRIVLPPGAYRVLVGTGEDEDRASIDVRVRRGQVTIVKPFFGAVRINVVDPDGKPHAGDYVVASADGRRPYGTVTMEVGPKAKKPPTLVLPPGHYIVALGTNERATTDTFAFTITAGEVVRYRLVVDSSDHVIRTEFGDDPAQQQESLFRVRWTLGASGSMIRSVNTLTGVQGDAIIVDAFSRFEGALATRQHLASLRLNVDQRVIALDDRLGGSVPARAYTNDVEGELLYNLRVAGVIGPYARALSRTALMATEYRSAEAMNVVTRDQNQNVVSTQAIGPLTQVRLLDPIHPLTFQEGVGAAITVVDAQAVTLVARGGGAARQAIYDGGRFIVGRNPATLDLQRLEDRSEFGGEATAILGIRVSQNLDLESRFDSFVPSDQFGKTLVPVFRWDNAATFRLGQYVSVAYRISLRRDEVVLPELQTLQSLGLRFNYAIF